MCWNRIALRAKSYDGKACQKIFATKNVVWLYETKKKVINLTKQNNLSLFKKRCKRQQVVSKVA